MLFPLRDLGSDGVISDIDPFGTTFKQFSMATNVRFENRKISRGPIFATSGSLTNTNPRYVVSYSQLSGTSQFHVCNYDGTIQNWSSAGIGATPTITDISASGWTPSNYDAAFTGTIINDVVYVNRPDRVPWFKTKSGSSFATLTNWDSTWRCASLRSVAGVLVAINVTKGAVAYPTMVKTSDYMVFDSVPGTWVGSTTNSATENVIADLNEPLVDGLQMRDRMILYSNHETWMMEPRYDQLMFNYRRLFTNRGVISQNCVAEANNVHYVFGLDDIWTHDGFNPQSLAGGKVRDFIFSTIDRTHPELFFVSHSPRMSEVMFCYTSNDAYCQFPVGSNFGYPGCNRAAVFNYRSGTWYFYDLPYVTSMGLGVPFAGTAYSDMGSITYDTVGGSTYASFASTAQLSPMTVSGSASVGSLSISSAVRSFDLYGSSLSNGPIDYAATAPCYIENNCLDLDEFKDNLRNYKVVTSIYPEGRINGSTPLIFYFGAIDYSGQNLQYDSPGMSFDGIGKYKLDYRTPGRYLGFYVTYAGIEDFALSGLDFEYKQIGSR
jgi:hypothetical protein